MIYKAYVIIGFIFWFISMLALIPQNWNIITINTIGVLFIIIGLCIIGLKEEK